MVANDIMVALIREKLDRKPADITNSVGAAFFAARSTSTEENWSFLADAIEKAGRREMRDIVGDLKLAPSTCSFGMNDPVGVRWAASSTISSFCAPLRNSLSVEMGQGLEEQCISQRR